MEPSSFNVVSYHNEVVKLSNSLSVAQKNFADESKRYDQEWQKIFKRACKEARLSWCTYCGAVRDSEYLFDDVYELYSKSDNYGPVFPHTATKHRVCSNCVMKLSTKKEAQEFDAMFNKDQTGYMSPDTEAELIKRVKINPRYPWKL